MKVETGNPVITIEKNNRFSDAVKKVTCSLSGIFKSIKGVFNSTLNINAKQNKPYHKETSWVYHDFKLNNTISYVGNKHSNTVQTEVNNKNNMARRVPFEEIHKMMSPWHANKKPIPAPRFSLENEKTVSPKSINKKPVPTPRKSLDKDKRAKKVSPMEMECVKKEKSTESKSTSLRSEKTTYSVSPLMTHPLFRKQGGKNGG